MSINTVVEAVPIAAYDALRGIVGESFVSTDPIH